MRKYRNTGAPIPRDDGTTVARGAVFEPTDAEIDQLRYKLRAVEGEGGGTVPGPGSEGKVTTTVDGWPLRMTPQVYLRLHPDGPHASRARELVEADEAEATRRRLAVVADEAAEENGEED